MWFAAATPFRMPDTVRVPRTSRRIACTTCVLAALVPALLHGQQTGATWQMSFPCSGSVTNSRFNSMMSRSVILVPMPEISGKPLQYARDTLAKLRLHTRAWPITFFGNADMVISQAPPAGTRVSPGDTVIFCWVQRTIPDVRGRDPDVAERLIVKEGYQSFRRDSIGPAARTGKVFAQRPAQGTAADMGAVDTIFVGLAPPVVIDTPAVRVPMPDVRRQSYASAVADLSALSQRNNLRLSIQRRGVNGNSFSTSASMVDSQQPFPGIMLSPQVLVTIMLRDPEVPPPPGPQVTMPRVVGLAYDDAARAMTTVSTRFVPPLSVLIRGINRRPIVAARTVVDSQFPDSGTTLSAQSRVSLAMRDTSVPVPVQPRAVTTMPNLIGASRTAAIDSITALNKRAALNLRFRERGTNDAPFTNASVVDSQRPLPRDSLARGDSVQIILGDSVRGATGPGPVVDTLRFPDRGVPRWWWPLGALSIFAIAAAASTTYVKRARARVDAMHLEAHVDDGRPRFVSADEAFARLGLSIEAEADDGTQRFHLTPSPRERDEASHV